MNEITKTENAAVSRQTTKFAAPDTARLMEIAIQQGESGIAALERLVAMQEKAQARAEELAFNAAMSAAQSEMGRVAADADNQQTKSRYATYGQLDRAVRPIYSCHGFALSFGTDAAAAQDHLRVTCIVTHREGHARQYHIDMPADGKGAKGGDVMTKTHATGAAATYGMRYLLKMIFNIAIGEDDTDGNMPADKISDEQAANLLALIEETNTETPKFLAWAGVDRVSDIQARHYARCIKMLERKRGAA